MLADLLRPSPPWPPGFRPDGTRREPGAWYLRCFPGSAAAAAAGVRSHPGRAGGRRPGMQHALALQHQHHLVVRVAMVRRPAWRNLTHELGGRTASVAGPEQDAELAISGDLHGAVTQLRQPRHLSVASVAGPAPRSGPGQAGGSGGQRDAVQPERARARRRTGRIVRRGAAKVPCRAGLPWRARSACSRTSAGRIPAITNQSSPPGPAVPSNCDPGRTSTSRRSSPSLPCAGVKDGAHDSTAVACHPGSPPFCVPLPRYRPRYARLRSSLRSSSAAGPSSTITPVDRT